MQLSMFPVVVVLLTASACRANIVLATSRPDESTFNLVEDVVNIMTCCYGDRIKAIGLAGNLPDILTRALSVRHLIPVTFTHIAYNDDDVEKVPLRFRQKLDVFIVEASSFSQLHVLIELNIKHSIWWNHMASFIILDMKEGCANGHKYLYAAWELNILNAKVMCYQRQSGTFILNYNPFTGQAPVSWRQYMVIPGIMKHPFTLFSQGYRENCTICADFDFEKTNNLGGSVIKVEGLRTRAIYTTDRHSYEFLIRIEHILRCFDALNATLTYSPDRSGVIGKNDIQKNAWMFTYAAWNKNKLTYPHGVVEVTLTSQLRSDEWQVNKILSVIDKNSRYCMVIVYLVTLIFFKFFARQDFGRAILNVIRITCNTGFTNVPRNIASQICLAALLSFAVAMHGICNSKLAERLTTNIYLPRVDTLQDVVDGGYKITYFPKSLIYVLDNLNVEKNRAEDDEDCIARVKTDPLTTCVADESPFTFSSAMKFNLHVSSKSMDSIYVGFWIKWDWPLEERVNMLIQKLVEADILDQWDAKCSQCKNNYFKFHDAVRNNLVYKKLGLSDLSFVFIILVVGLTCATVVLIIEVAMQYKFLCTYNVFIERRGLFPQINVNNTNATDNFIS